jgi:hypothetical protein
MPPEQGGTAGAGDAGSSQATSKADDQSNAGAGANADGAAKAGKPEDGQDQSKPDEYAELREALTKEREASRQLKADLKQLRDKDLPEAEKLTAEREELRAELERMRTDLAKERITNAVVAAAGRKGFADPLDAVRLVDIETDSEGKPLGVDKALDELLKTKPYLRHTQARAGDGDVGNTNGEASGDPDRDMNAMIRRAAGR